MLTWTPLPKAVLAVPMLEGLQEQQTQQPGGLTEQLPTLTCCSPRRCSWRPHRMWAAGSAACMWQNGNGCCGTCSWPSAPRASCSRLWLQGSCRQAALWASLAALPAAKLQAQRKMLSVPLASAQLLQKPHGRVQGLAAGCSILLAWPLQSHADVQSAPSTGAPSPTHILLYMRPALLVGDSLLMCMPVLCRHPCFACKGRGQPGVLVKCSMSRCGRYYHMQCLSGLPLTAFGKSGTTFKCALHYCARCGVSGNSKLMMQCSRCPCAYHVTCKPRDARVLSRRLLVCPRHTAEQQT